MPASLWCIIRASVTGPRMSSLSLSSFCFFLPSCSKRLLILSWPPCIPPPRSCFCPQSAPGRCMMGYDEDRSVNLRMRSHAWCCSRISDLTGPSSRRWDLSGDARYPEPPISLLSAFHAFVAIEDQAAAAGRPSWAKASPVLSIRCSTTASLRASATFAFFMPARLAMASAQLFSAEPFTGRVRMTFAAS